MRVPDQSRKAIATVSEMADLCELSRSRFYELMDAGVFPKPVQHPSSRRPLYDADLIAKCLEIRSTGIGLSGPVLFNRKIKKPGQAQSKQQRVPKEEPNDPLTETIMDAVKALGLTATAKAVTEAIVALYPTGIAGQDEGDVIRKVFLRLQTGKK